jgi:hypothetical protein
MIDRVTRRAAHALIARMYTLDEVYVDRWNAYLQSSLVAPADRSLTAAYRLAFAKHIVRACAMCDCCILK